jgi:hypothetical protein
MQKNSILLFCMMLIIQSNLQVANDFQPQTIKNSPAQLNSQDELKLPAKENINKFDQANLMQPILAIEKPFAGAIFELPQSINAPSNDQGLDLFSYFLRPINFSKEGITHYFKYTYNHEKYTEYLPYNFSHMIQFLEFGQAHEQNEAYAKSILKLFLQKIKGCDFINSYSLVTSMPKIADSLSPYIIKKEATFLEELQKSLKNRFSNIFSTYLSYFQKSPDAFLDALSEQIAKKTNEVQTQQHIDVENIKKDILRFLETCINKLVWSPKDAYDAWISVNEIATQSELFLSKKLLSDVDAFDDICWSLIHRFCYFMDVSSEDIPEEVFIKIINDIHTEKLVLFEIEEQEDLITRKKDFLLKKIKNFCTYTHPMKRKEYKVYSAQTIVERAQHEPEVKTIHVSKI